MSLKRVKRKETCQCQYLTAATRVLFEIAIYEDISDSSRELFAYTEVGIEKNGEVSQWEQAANPEKKSVPCLSTPFLAVSFKVRTRVIQSCKRP